MKKTIILGLLVLFSSIVCNAQESKNSTIDSEKECSETSKRYMSSVKEQTDIYKTSNEHVQSQVVVESDTYENARFTALSKAISTYIEAKNQGDTQISKDESQFMLNERMELNVYMNIIKTKDGRFKAECSLNGSGEKNINHLP